MKQYVQYLYLCFCLFLIGLAPALLNHTVSAQQPIIKWSSPPESANNSFGRSIGASSSHAIVGAPKANGDATESGLAYIYELSNLSDQPVQTLESPEASSEDEFGFSVAMTEDFAFVGARLDDIGDSTDVGRVYVFKRDGANWTFHQTINPPDTSSDMRFGGAIAAHEDNLVVGAPGADRFGLEELGSAFSYTLEDDDWVYEKDFFRSLPAENEHYGFSVDVHDTTAVVGMHYFTDRISFPAKFDQAHVFTRRPPFGNWSVGTGLSERNSRFNDKYAFSVATWGNRVLVGAYEDEYSTDDQGIYGVVHVYENDGNGWIRQDSLRADVPESFGKFGFEVDLEGNTAAIAAHDYGAAGAAFVFTYENGTWAQTRKFQHPNPPTSGQFGNYGTEVKLSGPYLMVNSALFDEVNGDDIAVYVYMNNEFVTSNDSEEDARSIPTKIKLDPAYPNPFNPSTTITYSLPQTSQVSVKVYNSIGRQVATLLNRQQAAGSHQIQWNAEGMAGGLYFIRLQTPNTQLVRKVTLIK